MSVVGIAPSATVSAAGHSVTGAATVHAALSDASEASWVQFLGSGPSHLEVDLANFTLAADQRVAGLRIAGRLDAGAGPLDSYMILVDPATNHLIAGRVDYQVADPINLTTGFVTRDSLGAEWSQAAVDAVKLRLQDNGGGVSKPRWISAEVQLDVRTRPVVTITSPADGAVDAAQRPRIFLSASLVDGLPVRRVQVSVFTAAVRDGGGFDPLTSQAVWTSGALETPLYQSVQVQATLDPLVSYYVYARVSVDFLGQDWWSPWDFAEFHVANTAPSAPRLVAPVSGAAVDMLDAAGSVSLQHLDADAGDRATAVAWRFRRADTPATYFWLNSGSGTLNTGEIKNVLGAPAENVTAVVPAGTLSAGTWLWSAKTWDQRDAPGVYSVENTLIISRPPSAGLVIPAEITDTTRPLVVHTFTDPDGDPLTARRLIVAPRALVDPLGTLAWNILSTASPAPAGVWDSGVSYVPAGSLSLRVDADLDNNTEYAFLLRVYAGGQWSDTAIAFATIANVPPLLTSVQIDYEPPAGAVHGRVAVAANLTDANQANFESGLTDGWAEQVNATGLDVTQDQPKAGVFAGTWAALVDGPSSIVSDMIPVNVLAGQELYTALASVRGGKVGQRVRLRLQLFDGDSQLMFELVGQPLELRASDAVDDGGGDGGGGGEDPIEHDTYLPAVFTSSDHADPTVWDAGSTPVFAGRAYLGISRTDSNVRAVRTWDPGVDQHIVPSWAPAVPPGYTIGGATREDLVAPFSYWAETTAGVPIGVPTDRLPNGTANFYTEVEFVDGEVRQYHRQATISNAAPPDPGGAWNKRSTLGVFVGAGTVVGGKLSQYSTWVGRPVTNGIGFTTRQGTASAMLSQANNMMIGHRDHPNRPRFILSHGGMWTTSMTFPQIINGDHDATYRALARQIRDVYFGRIGTVHPVWGHTLKLRDMFAWRLFHELNADHYQWSFKLNNYPGGSPSNGAAAWRHIVEVMWDEVPELASGDSKMCMDYNFLGNVEAVVEGWPGDDYVDVVTHDFYDRDEGIYPRDTTARTVAQWEAHWTSKLNKARGLLWLPRFADADPTLSDVAAAHSAAGSANGGRTVAKPFGIGETSSWHWVRNGDPNDITGGLDDPIFWRRLNEWFDAQFAKPLLGEQVSWGSKICWWIQFDQDNSDRDAHYRISPGGGFNFANARAEFLTHFGGPA